MHPPYITIPIEEDVPITLPSAASETDAHALPRIDLSDNLFNNMIKILLLLLRLKVECIS